MSWQRAIPPVGVFPIRRELEGCTSQDLLAALRGVHYYYLHFSDRENEGCKLQGLPDRVFPSSPVFTFSGWQSNTSGRPWGHSRAGGHSQGHGKAWGESTSPRAQTAMAQARLSLLSFSLLPSLTCLSREAWELAGNMSAGSWRREHREKQKQSV